MRKVVRKLGALTGKARPGVSPGVCSDRGQDPASGETELEPGPSCYSDTARRVAVETGPRRTDMIPNQALPAPWVRAGLPWAAPYPGPHPPPTPIRKEAGP